MTERQLATVLAALRMWQANQENDGDIIESMLHFETVTPLTSEEIDDLCEELNSI